MILVVDDHADTLRVLLLLLRRDGYEAAGVASGRAALEHMRLQVPHCVILDYNMPEMDGLDVLAAIRADPRYAHVRVILFSAQDGDLEGHALSAGANAYLRKDTLDWAKMQRLLLEHCHAPARPAPPADPGGHAQRHVG